MDERGPAGTPPPLVGWLVGLAGELGDAAPVLLAVTCAQSVALMWSRRFPLTVLAVAIGLELVLAALKMPVMVAPLVAASRLGAWGRGAAGWSASPPCWRCCSSACR
ncbi:hypothetical protein ACFQYP_49235 [Nonomuraea antimicrobica]